MRFLRIMLALLLALTLGGVPAMAALGEVAGPPANHCMGNTKKDCPCDKDQMPCAAASCQTSCVSFFVLPAQMPDTRYPRVSRNAPTVSPRLSQRHPSADPPVPRV